ncbi:MAG: hypothetical protein AB7D47_04265 [Desulfovibrio sp.]
MEELKQRYEAGEEKKSLAVDFGISRQKLYSGIQG